MIDISTEILIASIIDKVKTVTIYFHLGASDGA
jgi:hypothetical protein